MSHSNLAPVMGCSGERLRARVRQHWHQDQHSKAPAASTQPSTSPCKGGSGCRRCLWLEHRVEKCICTPKPCPQGCREAEFRETRACVALLSRLRSNACHLPTQALLRSLAKHAAEIKPGSTNSEKQTQYFKVLPSITISGTINNTCKGLFLNRYDFYLDGVSLNHFYPHKVCKKHIFCAPFILPNIHHPCLLLAPSLTITDGTGSHPPLQCWFPARDAPLPSLPLPHSSPSTCVLLGAAK